MMAPHWLDSVFQHPGQAITNMIGSNGFKHAIGEAQKAFAEADAAHKPGICGSSPAQHARIAFLKAMNEN